MTGVATLADNGNGGSGGDSDGRAAKAAAAIVTATEIKERRQWRCTMGSEEARYHNELVGRGKNKLSRGDLSTVEHSS